MKKKLLIIGMGMILLSASLSGCEEEVKSICDATIATPIVVNLEIVFQFLPSISAENFNQVNTNGLSEWWFCKTVNRCGVGSTQYSYHEKDATFDNISTLRFPYLSPSQPPMAFDSTEGSVKAVINIPAVARGSPKSTPHITTWVIIPMIGIPLRAKAKNSSQKGEVRKASLDDHTVSPTTDTVTSASGTASAMPSG